MAKFLGDSQRALCPASNRLVLALLVLTVRGAMPADAQVAPPASPSRTEPAPGQIALSTGIASYMRRDDPRLGQPIKLLLAPRITLPDLLARLTKETGVLLPGDKLPKGIAEIPLCALLRDTTLANTLDSLCSLLGYQNATWSILRQGTAGSGFQYRLLPSSNLRNVAADVREQIEAEFEGQDAKLRSALQMTQAERREAAKTDPDVRYLLDEVPPVQQRHEALLAAFFSLPADLRLRILRGAPAEVPLSALPPNATAYIENQRAVTVPKPPLPKTMTFMTLRGLTPMLMVGAKGLSLSNCIGGGLTMDAWRARIAGLWLLKGDVPDDAGRDGRTTVKPANARPFPEANRDDPDARAEEGLWKLSDAAPVSILAKFPIPVPQIGSSVTIGVVSADDPYAQTLSDYLAKVEQAWRLRHKWRNGILLLKDTDSSFSQNTAYPW